MAEKIGPDAQREVQRLLGRCLLRLQQYERLMKAVLAHHDVAAPASELEARLAARVEAFSDKSLGTLVKTLFDSYVVGTDNVEPREARGAATRADVISVRFQHRLQMEAERLAEVRAAVEELVRLRNELVHHLIERFDLWTEEGCTAAQSHLESCYARIDRHFPELASWAEGMDKARASMASFMQTAGFEAWLVDGIAPDGTVDWPRAGIVRALREALEANATYGWLRLEDARAWVAQHNPEQVPERYGCRSWPQVLNESRAFKLEYRRDANGKEAWLRACVQSGAV